MLSYFDDNQKSKCCGCGACKQVCPKNAIEMKPDKEGFIYPVIDKDKCVNCNLCKKICPISNDIKSDLVTQKVYALRVKDENLLQKSSSGGAFSAICEAFSTQNIAIFGAKYDENFNVIHDCVENLDEIYVFRKSKYVQSDIRNCYIDALKSLKEGKKVLFSGTPCQIAGLKKFLNKDYDNLLCVELICHGVPNSKIWQKYLDEIRNKYKSDIVNIEFRKKTKFKDKYNSRNIEISLKNEKNIIEDNFKNPYLLGFHNQLFYRPICKSCKFANPNRISDITISDCWGTSDKIKNLDVHEGLSMIVINTKKGYDVFENIKKNVDLYELDLKFAIENNAQFSKPTKFNIKREQFFSNLDNISVTRNVKQCMFKFRIKNKIKSLVPANVKNVIKKILK